MGKKPRPKQRRQRPGQGKSISKPPPPPPPPPPVGGSASKPEQPPEGCLRSVNRWIGTAVSLILGITGLYFLRPKLRVEISNPLDPSESICLLTIRNEGDFLPAFNAQWDLHVHSVEYELGRMEENTRTTQRTQIPVLWRDDQATEYIQLSGADIAAPSKLVHGNVTLIVRYWRDPFRLIKATRDFNFSTFRGEGGKMIWKETTAKVVPVP